MVFKTAETKLWRSKHRLPTTSYMFHLKRVTDAQRLDTPPTSPARSAYPLLTTPERGALAG